MAENAPEPTEPRVWAPQPGVGAPEPRDEGAEPELDVAELLRALQRRRWVIAAAFTLSVAAAAVRVFTQRPIYGASALLLIERQSRPTESSAPRVEMGSDDYYQTQFRLLKSRSLLKKVHAALSLQESEEFAGDVAALAGAVSILPEARSRLVSVRAESRSPELAARIANQVAETYVAENIENSLFIARDLLKAIKPAKEGGPGRAGYDSIPAVVNHPLLQGLKATLANLEVRSGELSARYTEEHPLRQRIKAELDAVRARLDAETRGVVQGMTVELSGQFLGNNVRVVDPAEVPRAPLRPRKRQALTAAALLGLVGGCILALGIDKLTHKIYSQEEVERQLGLPFLGSLMEYDPPNPDTALDYHKELTRPDSPNAEALRNIRTSLGFATARAKPKALLVTSSTQKEGKSFISIHLALSFAQLGKRVLLIDGDLRRPSLHRRFHLSGGDGLSHLLAHGQDASEAQGLVRETAIENLSVLPCGPIPPNPAELLASPISEALLAWARERYDLVLIDGTPVFPITDAMLWASRADAAIFVVKFGEITPFVALRASRKLRETGLRIAGAVVNRVTGSAGSYYAYDYSAYKRQAEA